MNDAELETALSSQGMTMDSLKVLIDKNLRIRKLLNQTVLSSIAVTDSDINAYYNVNIAQFRTLDKVTVQHILVAVTANRTENQSKDIILQVQKELNKTNFCELVLKYSDDAGSKGTCGEYTFAKGDFNNPEFENPSFDLKINQTAIVQTTFGWHLIKKLDTLPSRTLSLSEVYDQINKTVYDAIAQDNFDALITSLRSSAVIVNYVEKNASANNSAALLDDFAKCITAKGAAFYGASWCAHCQNQKELFGEALQYVQYVECADANNPQVQTPECTSAGVTGYPTWIINGQSYPGEQTIDSLAKLTGCTKP
jgi:thiol-disulfide isomerase/thioredoxin